MTLLQEMIQLREAAANPTVELTKRWMEIVAKKPHYDSPEGKQQATIEKQLKMRLAKVIRPAIGLDSKDRSYWDVMEPKISGKKFTFKINFDTYGQFDEKGDGDEKAEEAIKAVYGPSTSVKIYSDHAGFTRWNATITVTL